MSESLGAAKAKSRVFLVDDHPIVRYGVTQLIEREPDLMVCGQSANGTCVTQTIKASDPDIVVVDLALHRGSGFTLIKDLRTFLPNCQFWS